MGLFDYLNIADGGEDDDFSLDNDNNIDFGNLFKEKGVFGALDGINKNRENAYKDEVARTKLERGKSFFGSLATLGGQMIASGMGARQFNPIKDQTPQYNERLQRLRDAKRAEDAQTNNKSLSMMVRELDQKRADEWQNRQREDAANRDANKQQWDKYKYDADSEYKTNKDKNNTELKNREFEALERHRRAIEANGRMNAAANQTRANGASTDGSKRSYPKIKFSGGDGIGGAAVSAEYDMGNEADVAKAYNYAVQLGAISYKEPPKSLREMRERLLMQIGQNASNRTSITANDGNASANGDSSGQQEDNKTGSLLPR